MKGQGSALSGDWRGKIGGTKKPGTSPESRAGDCTPRVSSGAVSPAIKCKVFAAVPARPARHGAKPRIQGFHPCKNMPKATVTTPASYEAALEELEQLVGLIESGQLPLEQLLTGYQRGAELLQYCRDKLQAVEHQIKVLDEGVLKPWTQE